MSVQSPRVSFSLEAPVEAPQSALPAEFADQLADARFADEWAKHQIEDVRFLDEGEFFKTVGFCFADELQ